MKKLLALFLTLAMLLSLVPSVFAVPKEAAAEPDIWDVISGIEDAADAECCATNSDERTAAYNAKVDDIIEAVTSSSTYVPGSLERHGNFFFWVDTKGDPNGYSPSLRARQRTGAIEGADPADFAATEIVDYRVKGGSPSSIDVAAFQPYIGIDSSFTNQYEVRCNAIAAATGGVGTTYKTNNANINNLGLALSTCGVVIFDSHGTTDYSGYGGDYTSQANSSYLCLTTGTGITTQDKQSAQGEFGTYYHAFNSGGTWCVDGTAMANHMTSDAPNSMVWMAICLGMATNGMEAPFHNHGVEVVYGYSQSVTFSGDYKYEGFFWPYMCEDHTVAEACAYMKTKANCNWDPAYSYYSYSQAVANYVAFPIVSSSEDPYLGHGNVDVVQVPESTWTLFTQFEINAVSNNPDWGTVTLRGNKITATPAYGYYIDGYEVIAGEAEVTQNGNVFTVDPQSDCTVQINFARRDPAVVHFSVPEGVSCEDLNAYVGDTVTLPNPEGEPAVESRSFRFLGWIAAPMAEDSLDMPEFLAPGAKIKLTTSDSTYYALYSYFVAIDGLEHDQFVRVDEAPHSWAGEYVITYDGAYALGASSEYLGNNINNKLGIKKAVADLSALGCVYEGMILSGVTDAITYVIEPATNGTYTIKMKAKNQYLAMATDTDSLTTYSSSNSNKTRWTLSFGTNGPIITNAQFTGRTLQYNSSDKVFMAFSGTKDALTLFAKPDGDNWYTTNPKEKIVCEEHTFGDWTVISEPTCTEDGLEKRVCTVCGFAETNPIPAAGHVSGDPVKENETTPTCTEPGGYDMVTYCTVCQVELGREHTETQALGHVWNEPVYEWTETEDGWTCTGTVTCVRDESHVEQETVSAVYAEVSAPGYTAPGAATWTATFTDARFAEQVKDVEIPQLEPIVMTFLPGEIDGVPVPGEAFSLSTADEDLWGEASGRLPGQFFMSEGMVCICFPENPFEVQEGYLFMGWKSSKEGYTWNFGVGESYVAANDTLTAQWARMYSITTVPMDDIAVWMGLKEYAGADNNVPFIINMPEENWQKGYRLEKVTISNPEGEVLMELTTDLLGTPLEEYEPVLTNGIRSYPLQFLMPASDVVLTASFKEPEPEHDCKIAHFTDVIEAYPYGTVEHAAIEWAFTHEPVQITKGTGTNTFSPELTVKRCEAMTFLWNMAGRPEPTTTNNPFTDVKSSKYYYKAVLWAVEMGITKGTAADKFSPNKTCNRAEILGFLYNYLGKPEITIDNPYTDVKESAWYRNAAVWAYQAGIEMGADGKFAYKTNCTRASIVTYLYLVETGMDLAE